MLICRRYNSAFYKSLTTNDYNVYIVSQDFVDGSAFNMTENASPHLPYARQHDFKIDIAGIQNGTKTPGLYEQLQKADCIRAYATDFVTNRRNLLMVTKHDPSVTTLFDIIPYTFSVFDDLYTW